MKTMNAFLLLAFLLTTNFANAEVIQQETVVSARTVTLPINIAPGSLKLSEADYTMPTVKVLVPELADVTVMNHRNTREGAPCLATLTTNNPMDVIQNNPAIEHLPVRVVLKKIASLDTVANKCSMRLSEIVTVTIRGHEFSHERGTSLPARHPDDCR